ncbi:MAG: hypothetical protein R3316_00550 [Rhodovibrionaceae bacterium]|nr:hypothetical protein [Rhodovibrionaceae bacterium]
MAQAKHHTLKPVRVGDSWLIEAPEHWVNERLEDGRWWCGDRETGVGLFMNYSNMPVTEGVENSADGLTKLLRATERLSWRFLENQGPIIERTSEDRQNGTLLTAVQDLADDEGETCRFYRFYALDIWSAGVVAVTWSLVVPFAYVDTPACRELVEIFGRQIRKVEITDQNNLLGELRERDFNGRMRLALPDIFILEPNEVSENSWWAVRRDGDRGRIAIHVFYGLVEGGGSREDLFDRLLGYFEEQVLPVLAPPADMIDMQVGAVDGGRYLYTIHNDDEPDPDEEMPDYLRLHTWVLVAPFDGGYVDARLVLMIPLNRVDEPQFVEMVKVLEEAIPQAKLYPPETDPAD